MRLTNIHCIVVFPFLVLSPPAQASASVCGSPAESSEVSAGFVSQEEATLEPPPGTTREEHRIFNILLKPAAGRWSFGVGYRYATLGFDDLTPQSNAHLHTTYFPVHRIREGNHTSFRASVAPALSASSNIIGRPQEYRSDTFQFLFALAWQRQLAGWTLRYGLCGDHRFGEYRVYPSIGAVWKPHPDWTLDIGFPDSQLTYQINRRFSSGLGVAPEGNDWHVADRSMTEESRLVYEGYVIHWQLQWDVTPEFAIGAGLGATMDSRYELTLIDGNRIRLGADPALRLSAGLRWKF